MRPILTMSLAFASLLGLPGASGCSQDPGSTPHPITETRTTLQVGSTPIDLVQHATATPGLTYINLHDDEQTSVEAALDVIGRYGGRVFELQHGDVRNVEFSLGDTVYVFDPNRMFTDGGAAASLKGLGPYSDAALRAVRAFADEALSSFDLGSQTVVITLHNNSSGNYSAESYLPGAEYEGDAADVVVHDGVDPDDFFFVTDPDLHAALGAAGFNSVLQDNEQASDDGSLSVWAAREGKPYVNSEAKKGHLEAQIEMLLGLRRILGAGAGS